ncbi:mariner Mos1 transposase [Trichonephila clavipes]|nr:mariner Mos1 transposase [Trichonephila clavipes]
MSHGSLRERVRKKGPDLQSYNTRILHQDNAPVHISLSVLQFLVEKRIIVLENPRRSLDLLPYEFYSLLKVKNALIGTHFRSVEEVKAKTNDLLKMVTHK